MEVNLYNDFNINSEEGSLISIYGACGSGKTKLMIDFAIKYSLAGVDCAFFSAELTEKHLKRFFNRALTQKSLTSKDLKGRILLKSADRMTTKDIFNFIQSNKSEVIFIDSIMLIDIEKIINPIKRILLTEKTVLEKKIDIPITLYERNKRVTEEVRIISTENNVNTFISFNAPRNNATGNSLSQKSSFIMSSDLALLVSKDYAEDEYEILGGNVRVEKNRHGIDGNDFKIKY